MREIDVSPCRYGTSEPPDKLRLIETGPLSFLYSQEGLRRISWRGTELIRAIAWPIRDENWGTYPVEVSEEAIEERDGACTGRLRFSVAEGDLACTLTFSASAEGRFDAELLLEPSRAFRTNRAGFTVLHPIRGVAGAPLTVTHPDGRREKTRFPELISPDQPVMQIAGLRYGVDGATADIAFTGEVFEMEDQRNWSDASYKTYCVPLVYPFTYTLEGPVRQGISVRLDGGGASRGGIEKAAALRLEDGQGVAPDIGLAIEPGWLATGRPSEIAATSGAGHLLVRIGPATDPSDLSALAAFARRSGAPVDAEIVLPQGGDARAGLSASAEALAAAGIDPARVIALTEGYLASHQPSGPWPEGPTPSELCPLVRAAFPDAGIGGGVMTNFTEFNRCRPDPAVCDFVTHGSTAIVHAGDDMSVLETLECLPQIFASAEALSGGLPYRLGLVSIGMRSNPYGADVAANPAQVRRTMARTDPRHRGLFGAAWAVGVLAATAGSAVSALCLAAPTGPFGIACAPQPWPREGYDGRDAEVTPLWHVHRTAAGMSGKPRLLPGGLPEDIAAFGVRDKDGSAQVVLANLSTQARTLSLPENASCILMDETTFTVATESADWLTQAVAQTGGRITLAPFAIAFARIPPG